MITQIEYQTVSSHYRAIAIALGHTFTCAMLALASMGAQADANGYQRNLMHSQPQGHHKQLKVNCDRGQRLAAAVKRAKPGSTIRVRGTCYEQIKIKTDDLRLVGVDGAVIDGDIGKIVHEGTVTVSGAQRVRLVNLEIRNGPDQGVVVTKNASAVLKKLNLHGNKTTGLTVDASYAELRDINSYNNGIGFDFFTGAVVIAKGPLAATDNSGAGFGINAQSTLELRGSVIETRNNGGDGITLVNDSQLIILSFPESQGSGVTAQRNGGAAGLFVANSHVSVVGSNFAGSGANLFEVAGHGVGMLFISSNFSAPFGTAKFNVHDNGVGILLSDNSDAFLLGGLNISSNGIGVLGDGAGVVRLRPSGSNPSSVTGNADTDVLMTFGSRIELAPGVGFGTFACDPTVLTPLGAATCP